MYTHTNVYEVADMKKELDFTSVVITLVKTINIKGIL